MLKRISVSQLTLGMHVKETELRRVAEGQRQFAPVSAAVEIERATRICQQAKQAVVSMFEEARMGNTVDVGGAKLLVEEIADSVARNPGALISLARLKTADDYDAITSNRPYKAGWDPAESLRKMAEWTRGHFDPHVFQAFVKSIGIYPVGSLLRLSSGRIGVVVEQTAKSLTTPCVNVFFSTKSNMRIVPHVLDLSSPDTHDKIVGREDPAKWHFPDLNALWSELPAASCRTR